MLTSVKYGGKMLGEGRIVNERIEKRLFPFMAIHQLTLIQTVVENGQ